MSRFPSFDNGNPIHQVLDVEKLFNLGSGSIERMASGKKAQASSKEDSLQTCQLKNQIKPLLMLKKSDQSPTTHKMYLSKKKGVNRGINDQPKLGFVPPSQKHPQKCKCRKLLMATIWCFVRFHFQIAYFLLNIFGKAIFCLYIEVVFSFSCKNSAQYWQNYCPMKICSPHFENTCCFKYEMWFHVVPYPQLHPRFQGYMCFSPSDCDNIILRESDQEG